MKKILLFLSFLIFILSGNSFAQHWREFSGNIKGVKVNGSNTTYFMQVDSTLGQTYLYSMVRGISEYSVVNISGDINIKDSLLYTEVDINFVTAINNVYRGSSSDTLYIDGTYYVSDRLLMEFRDTTGIGCSTIREIDDVVYRNDSTLLILAYGEKCLNPSYGYISGFRGYVWQEQNKRILNIEGDLDVTGDLSAAKMTIEDSLLVCNDSTRLYPHSLMISKDYQTIGTIERWNDDTGYPFGHFISVDNGSQYGNKEILCMSNYFQQGENRLETAKTHIRNGSVMLEGSSKDTTYLSYGNPLTYEIGHVEASPTGVYMYSFRQNITTATQSLEITREGIKATGAIKETPSDTLNDQSYSPYKINASIGLIDTAILLNKVIMIIANGSAVDVSAEPQIATGTAGQIIELWGTSDVLTVEFNDGAGLQLAGGISCILGEGDNLVLRYIIIDGVGLWREISRSDN